METPVTSSGSTGPVASDTTGTTGRVLRAILISYIGFGASFLSSILLARVLGAAGKGEFSLFQASISTVTVLTMFGIGQGQQYYVARDPSRLANFMPNALIVSLVLGGGSAALCIFAGFVFNLRIVATLGPRAFIVGAVCLPIVALLNFQRQYLLVTHEYVLAKVSAAFNLASPLLAFTIVYLVGRVTIGNLVIAFVATQVTCALVFQLIVAKRTRLVGRFSVDFARMAARFGVLQYLSDLALALTSRLDFFIVAYVLGKSALGIYSVAVGLAEVVLRLPNELGTILFPAFASGKIPEGHAAQIVRRVFMIGAVISFALMLISEPLVTKLYGDRFHESVAAFRWLLVGTVAWSTIFVTLNHTSSGGRPGAGIPIFGVAAFVDAALCFYLLPKIGVIGASIAAAMSYWLVALLFLRIFCRREHCQLHDVLVPRVSDIKWLIQQVRAQVEYLTGRLLRSPSKV